MKRLIGQLKRRLSPLLAVALAFMLLFTMSASLKAAPGDDIATKSQQAAQVSQEINALDQQLSVSTDAYDRVKTELDAITMKVDDTRIKLSQIRQDLSARRDLLNKRVAEMYMDGRASMLEVLLRTTDFSDFLDKTDYVARVAQDDSDLINRIRDTRDSVQQVEQQLAEQQRQQQGLVDQASAQKSDIETKLQQRQQILAGLNQEIQNLLAQQQQASAAESAALAQQAEQSLATAPSEGLAQTALKYLGVPYHWAGAGPGMCPTGEHPICFDCSGLTMYVYKLFGIDLPHNAALQFDQAVKIPLSQAKPGDLVFFGMPPHHVGMYLGNDMFIQAPQTGDVVKVSRLSSRSDLSGVGRFSRDISPDNPGVLPDLTY
jgi:cell wall-associated NlpC family hydrolase